MASLSNTDLRNGTVFRDGGVVYVVVKYEHQFRGRGGSIVKVKVRSIKTGGVVTKSYRQNERVEAVDTRKATLQYLYAEGDEVFLMDTQTFEQLSIPAEMVGGLKYLKNGEKVVGLFVDDALVSIEIPKSVELQIEQTEPGAKGNTANNPTKKAILENGLQVDVPLFVKVGDRIKVNTETGSYVSRV